MLSLAKTSVIDEITVQRIAGDEKTEEHAFYWKNFQLFNSSGKEIISDDF